MYSHDKKPNLMYKEPKSETSYEVLEMLTLRAPQLVGKRFRLTLHRHSDAKAANNLSLIDNKFPVSHLLDRNMLKSLDNFNLFVWTKRFRLKGDEDSLRYHRLAGVKFDYFYVVFTPTYFFFA